MSLMNDLLKPAAAINHEHYDEPFVLNGFTFHGTAGQQYQTDKADSFGSRLRWFMTITAGRDQFDTADFSVQSGTLLIGNPEKPFTLHATVEAKGRVWDLHELKLEGNDYVLGLVEQGEPLR